jgi:hypothetical protein
MSHGNELPKIIAKTQADIDAAIATIQNSDISASTKDCVLSAELRSFTESTGSP